jgi:hypothetical protein
VKTLEVACVLYLAACGALLAGCSRTPTDDSRSASPVSESVSTVPLSAIGPISSTALTGSALPMLGPAASAPVGKGSRCGKFCSHTAPLHCGPRETCEGACGSMLGTPCQDRVQAFLDCVEKEPVAHWECVNGLPAIRDGYCDAEQARILECIQSLGGHTTNP